MFCSASRSDRPLDEAKKMYQRALAGREKALGPVLPAEKEEAEAPTRIPSRRRFKPCLTDSLC